jgi:hypothetical protein
LPGFGSAKNARGSETLVIEAIEVNMDIRDITEGHNKGQFRKWIR